jgi:hypothetical protein
VHAYRFINGENGGVNMNKTAVFAVGRLTTLLAATPAATDTDAPCVVCANRACDCTA